MEGEGGSLKASKNEEGEGGVQACLYVRLVKKFPSFANKNRVISYKVLDSR